MPQKLFDRLRAWWKERAYLRTVAQCYGVVPHWYEGNRTRAKRVSAKLIGSGNSVRRVRVRIGKDVLPPWDGSLPSV